MSDRLLLATDLDGTLLPDGSAPESPAARERFARVVRRPEVTLAYVTGRHRGLVEEAMASAALPPPRFVVGDVGTTICEVEDGSWTPVSSWTESLAEEWPEGTTERLLRLLGDLEPLRPQEESKQGRFKASFYVGSAADPGPWLEEVRQRIRRDGPAARIIFSRDATKRGLLDLLPPRGGKLAAVRALMAETGIPASRTVFAGDSGNDLEVLASDLPAVLVANADDGVRLLARQAGGGNGSGRLYLARGGFLGMNGNFAAGVLEGLAHFLPETSAWMS